jgi:hypothetical protein
MARARNIKPGFFKNADLLELEPLTRLLFAGLWCLADREGRVEDRPRQIKLEVLPVDDCNVDAMLCDLHNSGFINRYEVHGEKFLRISKWKKHQNPHVKEIASAIPAPEATSTGNSGTSPVITGTSPVITRQFPAIPEPTRLIPDSLNLIPDSLIPHPVDDEFEPEPETEAEKETLSDAETIRAWLEEFTEGKFGKPSDPLIRKMLELLGESPIEIFQDFLISLHERKLKPDKSYGWFITMAENYFGGFDNGRK